MIYITNDIIIYWRYWPAIQEITYLIIFSR